MAKGKKADAKAEAKAESKAKSAMKRAGEQVAEQVQSAAATVRDVASGAAKSTSKINLAVIDQVEANTQAAFAAMRAAASAASVGDVVKVQREYVKEQGQRSMAQAKEIGDMIAQFGRDAVAQMRGKK
jgi:hypothetical protein